MTAILAFVLLIAALLLFLISTKQWPLMVRGAVWGSGLLLLLIAGFLVINDDAHGGGLLRALGDLGDHLTDPGKSEFVQSIAANGSSIEKYVLSLLDLFILLGFILGIIALVAFSPGEELERALRPVMIGLVGAILGGALAVAVVGSGLSLFDQSERVVHIRPGDVLDGDTFRIGTAPRIRVHLAGIDAPELDQSCLLGQTRTNCGEAAQQNLQRLFTEISRNGPITCAFETYEMGGLPAVTCRGRKAGETGMTDLSVEMARNGYAIESGIPGSETDPVREEQYRQIVDAHQAALNDPTGARGLMMSCTLRPYVWRNSATLKNAFINRRSVPAKDYTMGRCTPTRDRQPDPPIPPPR